MKTKLLARLLILTMILTIGLISVTQIQAEGADEANIRSGLNSVQTTAALPDGDGVAGTSLFTAIGEVIKIFLSFLAVIFIILVIYAGFLWMTAAGDDSKITKAKGIITSAIIGIVIILAAYIITDFVIDKVLTATGTTGTQVAPPDNGDNTA